MLICIARNGANCIAQPPQPPTSPPATPQPATSQPATSQPLVAADHPTRPQKAYCGIRCLYAAAIREGLTFPGNDLIQPRYIGSREGSSLEELEAAARDHGLHTFAFVNGTTDALRSISHPVILHVTSTPGTARYDHFILFLGTRGSQLLLLDATAPPGRPAALASPRDLELIWDGTGIVVSKAPIGAAVLAASWVDTAIYASIAITLVMLLKLLINRLPTSPLRSFVRASLPAQMLVILAFAALAPWACALCAGSGLLAHPAQVALVEQTNASYFLPRVSLEAARQALIDRSAVFVDARYAADFGAGHIPGAINVPVTTTDTLLRMCMAPVPESSPLIVYCQSKSCPFSKSVAAALLRQGYTSVKLLDGGWEEWSTWKH